MKWQQRDAALIVCKCDKYSLGPAVVLTTAAAATAAAEVPLMDGRIVFFSPLRVSLSGQWECGSCRSGKSAPATLLH